MTPPRTNLLDPSLLGTACCLLSAVCYTAANICLRQAAELQLDPAWVICVKETVSVVALGPLVLLYWLRGVRLELSRRALIVLILAGLGVQLLGNLNLQWAFGVVGLAISMPLVFGTMLIGSGLMGRLVFREPLAMQSLAAVALVIVSVALLGVGASRIEAPPAEAPPAARPESSSTGAAVPAETKAGNPAQAEAGASAQTQPAAFGTSVVLLGLGAACLCGMMFASLAAAIRYAAQARVPIVLTVLVVTGMGFLSLGTISLIRQGPGELLATEPHAMFWMIASGCFNLCGFALISKGLQLTTLVHANVLNVSQAAMGAAAGILLFREPYNSWLLAGISLTLVGIAILGRPRPTPPTAAPPAP